MNAKVLRVLEYDKVIHMLEQKQPRTPDDSFAGILCP